MVPFNLRLSETIKAKRSLLCVGLDMHPDRLGADVSLSDVQRHAENVVTATRDVAAAYKPNLAFFERWGSGGFQWLEELVGALKQHALVIGDAKRGDIGSTAEQYAYSLFHHFDFDAVTVNPYLGSDSILPFSADPAKGVFILCRTSNPSAGELQALKTEGGRVFEQVARLAVKVNQRNNVGLVVGATNPGEIRTVRNLAPDLPLLIPGVGHQGGDLQTAVEAGRKAPVLINVSRAISFAGDLSLAAIWDAAETYVNQMRKFLDE